ncbi:MAG: hypothetical protein PHI47_06455 [Sulfuricurvum sp.]|uniref:hypothetical protein n=1 Tax=Sulfuricurvum sp. TaxID=2025608 RepID=UPI0026064069|nr:hypothetical protein [Sulfuricurvum sp.]MDD5159675.1 hypothetical protein [Sulfuricurvum sp.]
MKEETIYVNNLKSSQKLVVTIKLSKEMKIRLFLAKLLFKIAGKVLGNGAELKNSTVGVGG